MSAAPASGAGSTANKKTETATPANVQKTTATLEEDDEFEDFPVEGKTLHFLLLRHYMRLCLGSGKGCLLCRLWDSNTVVGRMGSWETSRVAAREVAMIDDGFLLASS